MARIQVLASVGELVAAADQYQRAVALAIILTNQPVNKMLGDVRLLEEPEKVRAALSPLRRKLLDLLQEPSSGTQLAAALELPRQRVSYHLRELEKAGLVELVEERQRRGCVERILRATSEAFVVDPAVMGRAFSKLGDHYAAEHLVEVAAGTVRDVARMQNNADAAGQRLLTFTIEAEVRFAEPSDLHRFTDALTEALRQTIDAFDTEGGRLYRLIAGGHPAPRNTGGEKA